MAKLRATLGGFCLTVCITLPALGSASLITLRRDCVIPVILEDKLTISDRHEGDVFTVRVADDGPLPHGSELLGRIDRIHPAKGNHPSSMDIRFTRILMPDNSRINLDAAAIPLDDRYITRGGDGRLVAKQDIRKQQGDVIGGAIGGFIVGSIFHRRVAGTIIGTILGAAAAESDRQKDNNIIANPGDKLGALVNHDVVIDLKDGIPNSIPDRSSYGRLDQRMADPLRHDSTEYRVREENQISDRHFNFVVTFKGANLQFPSDAKPYWIGDTIMVPLEPVASQMGLDVDRRKDRTIYVDGPDTNLKLTQNSRQARLNGDALTLPRTVAEHNGVVFVPLEALLPLSKDPVFVNGTKYVGKS